MQTETRRYRLLLPLGITLGLALVLSLPAAAQRDGAGDCNCRELAAALNAAEVEISDLEGTLEGYRDQLSIPGRIATSLEGYDVRAVDGRCKSGEGRVGLEAGWRLCFPIGNSAEVIPFITEFLDQLGYDPSDFREAAENAPDLEAALERARRDREQALRDCARCRCEC